MSCSSGPEIINDGLVLHLDAKNTNSYPGAGSIWYDISGKNNHATLVDTGSKVTYNSLGYFQHTVTAYFGAPTSSESSLNTGGGFWEIPHSASLSPNSSWTISGFINVEGDQSGNGGGWLHKPGSGDERGVNVEAYGVGFRANGLDGWSQMYFNAQAWQNQFALYTVVFTQVSGVYGTDPGTFDFYINGELVFSDASFTPVIDGASNIWLGRRQGHWRHFFKGQYANFHFYNKALTSSEVKQNFNALKSRFNL